MRPPPPDDASEAEHEAWAVEQNLATKELTLKLSTILAHEKIEVDHITFVALLQLAAFTGVATNADRLHAIRLFVRLLGGDMNMIVVEPGDDSVKH